MAKDLDCRQKLDSVLADFRLAEAQADAEAHAKDNAERRAAVIAEAQATLQTIAQGIQNQAHAKIARVATRCIKSVFGEDSYELRIEFDRKRGKTEARIVLVKEGIEVDPLDAAGGGVVDVISIALRIACLTLSRPRRRQLLVLDEPFRFVSKGYRPAVRRLIEVLAEELGIQFLLVTHSQEFMIGKVIDLEEFRPSSRA